MFLVLILLNVLNLSSAEKQYPSVSVDYSASRDFSGSKINVHNVATLQLKWYQNITSYALCPPVEDRELNAIYVTDFLGNVYAFKKHDGTPIWQISLPTVLGIPSVFSRTPPVIIGEHLWMGTNSRLYNPYGTPAPQPAAIPFVLDRRTGALVFKMSSVDDHPGAIFTGGPTYVKESDLLIWGVSSNEETFAYYEDAHGVPYPCCSFSGSIVGIQVSTHTLLWKVYTTTFPDQTIGSRPVGYPSALLPFSGVAVWLSGPAVDTEKGYVYYGTGNNYLVPDVLRLCVDNVTESCAGQPNQGMCVADGNLACYGAYQIDQNLAESLIVLSYVDGAIVKTMRMTNELGYTIGCFRPPPFANCPATPGQDQDFGQALLLMHGGKPLRPVIVMNQKGGMTYTIDRSTYSILYANQTVVGGVTGGHQWGSAFHGHTLLTTGSNSNAPPRPDKLLDGTTTLFGVLMAYDTKNDKWLWKVPDPAGIPKYSRPMGAVAYTNGVMFATSNAGNIYAYDAKTGTLLWNQAADGSSIVSGVAIGRRGIWVNTGYQYLNLYPSQHPRIAFYELQPHH
ncbi:MAG: Pqq-dependent dehydrogenase [Solumvirus sp.]|uniref:Pqq-dependent dehydrogenase n=1 Tax=Solumvirus sp. TaxID=2487773 RepID=A0A3G5AIH3_9VIRU|nr:MAG: Pqq-dependent dehydrogenase [Solumvirus sp.]